MSEINRGLDHMAEQQRTWSPGRAVLPPDPEGHNRLLDRGAAEHLASVAPWLACGCVHDSPNFVSDAQQALEARGFERVNRHAAPCLSCQTGLCGEHGPARVETTTGAAVFCDECGVRHRPGENTLCPKTQREGHPAWKEAARMNEWLKPHVAPAPVAETSGEVSPEGLRLALDPFYRQAIYAGMADAVGNREMVNEHADRAEEALKPVFAAWTALRASRDEERARADKAEWKVRHQEGVTATWGREYTKAIDERDEAREQRDAALDRADEVTRDLAAAEAEVASLRGRVAEDNAVCLCGCPADQHEDGDQDGESCGRDDHECLRVAPAVATLFAALRERCRRLEEAGDKMAALGTWPTACGWSLRDAWAAAKGALDAPAAGGGKG